eukprot:Skav218188  [mRNA]  locus=scaffold5213:260424:266628:- [translate_table: standard]
MFCDLKCGNCLGEDAKIPTIRVDLSLLKGELQETETSSSSLPAEVVQAPLDATDLQDHATEAQSPVRQQTVPSPIAEDVGETSIRHELREAERKAVVAKFLEKYGFSGINVAKRSLLSGSHYALHKAAELADQELVIMLLAEGADPLLRNSSGRTAADVAKKRDNCGSHADDTKLQERRGGEAVHPVSNHGDQQQEAAENHDRGAKTLPINQIFRYLQNRSRVQVWLHEQADLRIEGRILGFDEYMNLVIDDAEDKIEIMVKKKTRRAIGRILLKGDNICLMMNTGRCTAALALLTGVNAASDDSQVQTVDMYRAMQMPKDGKDIRLGNFTHTLPSLTACAARTCSSKPNFTDPTDKDTSNAQSCCHCFASTFSVKVITGGLCDSSVSEPTGDIGCVYQYEASVRAIRPCCDLRSVTCCADVRRKCSGWKDWRDNCYDPHGKYKRKFHCEDCHDSGAWNVTNQTTGFCVEYDLHPFCQESQQLCEEQISTCCDTQSDKSDLLHLRVLSMHNKYEVCILR